MLLSTTNISKNSLTHHVSSEISEIGSSFSLFFSLPLFFTPSLPSFIVCGWYSSYVFLIYKSLLSLSPLQSIFEEIALFTWSNFPKVFI